MPHYTPAELTLIITSICTGICSIIAALRSGQAKAIGQNNNDRLQDVKEAATKSAIIAENNNQIAVMSHRKLDNIQDLTNGNLSEVKNALSIAENRIDHLNRVINNLLDQLPPGAMQEAKQKSFRREGDVNRLNEGEI